ncbi:MAG: sigma-70 family RNA polymerase sigma factor [Bacteroidales bacterium]|jgi:RNA polymerase sigma factor (sigma-70 family)|nr:sigma-70 family RNA polymerase sigma factor [Bacteroidales bacterium]
MTDKEFLQCLRTKNEAIISQLYVKYRNPFFGYFFSHYQKCGFDVDDVYQDSFTTLWQNVNSGKLTEESLKCSLITYLIAVGRYILMARDRKFKEIIDDEQIKKYFMGNVSDEEEVMEKEKRCAMIKETVKNIQEPCATLLDKFYWEDKSGEEIANDMGYKNTDTVKNQKYKCMQKLKTYLKEHGIE